jgi:hypothetical protein
LDDGISYCIQNNDTEKETSNRINFNLFSTQNLCNFVTSYLAQIHLEIFYRTSL